MQDLQRIEYEGQLVLTTAQLAEAYSTNIKNIHMNYANNSKRFIHGKHLFILEGELLRQFKNRPNLIGSVGKNARSLTLWTHQGASRHCKLLDTDEAWAQFDILEETYFKVRQSLEDMISDPDFGISLLTRIKEQREINMRLVANIEKQQRAITELKPKADYYDLIMNSPGLLTITQIAKDYGMSGQKFNNMLHDYGIQYKQRSQWLLYAQYQNHGYTHSQAIPIERRYGPDFTVATYWTQKGRVFLYRFLKQRGVLPMIEMEQDAEIQLSLQHIIPPSGGKGEGGRANDQV